ncbi:MAG: PspA/IM30 family protein [Deltaproteobacteria bacterium]|nr:PspA/IM30 family protein [Deltaproteobacteria bacterium]
MSIFKRFSDLVRSNVNSALDQAEDPRKVLEQTILDMEGEHKKAKQKLLESMTLLKTTEKQAETLKKSAADWEQKAIAALKANSEELARQALGEKQKAEEVATRTLGEVEVQKASTEQLKVQIKQFEEKIGEAKRRKDEMIARLNAADMQKKQAAIASGTAPGANAVNSSTAFDTFNRMVEKIENSEAEAEARSELLGVKAPEVDAQLAKLSQAQSADDALNALKAKMSTSTAAPAAPAGDAKPADGKAAAIDDELAALRAKLGG